MQISFRTFRLPLLAAAVASLAACVTAPQPLQGQFTPVTPREAVGSPQAGAPVRWGGRIISVTPMQDSTCFQLVSRPLNATGRPMSSAPDVTDGRFVACRAGFYDPAVFAVDREVTFVGRVTGTERVRIGEYDYRLPKMNADVVYLWPEVREVQVRPYPYGPYGPWGPWGYGGYGRFGWW